MLGPVRTQARGTGPSALLPVILKGTLHPPLNCPSMTPHKPIFRLVTPQLTALHQRVHSGLIRRRSFPPKTIE